MKTNKEKILEEIENNDFYKSLYENVPEEDKIKIKEQILIFVEAFSSNILEQFESVSKSPEAIEETRKKLIKKV